MSSWLDLDFNSIGGLVCFVSMFRGCFYGLNLCHTIVLIVHRTISALVLVNMAYKKSI